MTQNSKDQSIFDVLETAAIEVKVSFNDAFF